MGMCVFRWAINGVWNGDIFTIITHGLILLVNMQLVQMVFRGSVGAGFVGTWFGAHEPFVRRCYCRSE